MDTTRPPSSTPSYDAVGKLEQAILFMIKAYLDGRIIERAQVLNMLEDVIQRVERDRSKNEMNC